MPELPEVETIVRELNRKIKNKTVKAVEVRVPKIINLPVKQFNRQVIRVKIKKVTRRAKLIIIDLVGKYFLLIHLKMTGQLIFSPKKGKLAVGGHPIKIGPMPGKFTRVIFTFSDNSKLYFNDIRKFGYIKLIDDKEMVKVGEGYGPEPFSRDFTLLRFRQILFRYSSRMIKQVLLDQKLIAGIGNIYADESCFYARILPTRRIKSLRDKEIKDLYSAIKKVLLASIKKGGTSAENYVRTDGRPGGFVPYLKVYGREGERCLGCHGTVKKIRLNGRGTHFCPSCQT